MSTFLQTVTTELAAWSLDGHDARVAQQARTLARTALAGHPALDAVAVVVTELVTNAHLHSLSGQEGGIVSIGLVLGADAVSVVVTDSGAAPHGEDRIDNGRGLMICMAFGHVAITDDEDGRTVIVTIPAGGAA